VRRIWAAACLGLIVVACGGGTLSLTEYVESLNVLVSDARGRLEAMYVQYGEISSPGEEDVTTLFSSEIVIRTDFQEGLVALDPPERFADLHAEIVETHGRILAASELLPARVGTVASREEFEQSAEFEAYQAANAAGTVICGELQAKLDTTADLGIFADVPWIPGEMKEVVAAALGCEERIGQ